MRRSTKLPEMKNLPPSKTTTDQAKEIIERAKEINRDGAVGAMVVNHTITALILASLVALGFWLQTNFKPDEFFTSVDHVERRAGLDPFLAEAQQRRIASALEVHHRLHGRYPITLEGLVEAGLLTQADLFHPAGADRWSYRRHEQSFHLSWNPGPTPLNQDNP
jgi:hypothetical protein